MKEEDSKKCRCAVRMVCDEAVEDYEDVQFSFDEFDRSEVCKTCLWFRHHRYS